MVATATQHLSASTAESAALQRSLAALAAQLDRISSDLDLFQRPFEAPMTMDQAWRRHPNAKMVFARYHLPACDGCAVRFDETLSEAAAAYGLDLDRLLTDLNALL
jgi:hybrid cluster-associated redox disulfide protein